VLDVEGGANSSRWRVVRRDYDCADVAEMFGIPVEAIRRRASRGEIPHLRLGHRFIRFTDDDIAEIERIFRVEAQPAPVLLDRQRPSRPAQRPNLAAVGTPPVRRRRAATA